MGAANLAPGGLGVAAAVGGHAATSAPTNTVAPTLAPPLMPPPTPIYGGGVQPSPGGQPPGMPTTGQADLSGLLFAVLAGLSLGSLGLLARRRVAPQR